MRETTEQLLPDYAELLERYGKNAADYIISERVKWIDTAASSYDVYAVMQISPRRWSVIRVAYRCGKDNPLAVYVSSGVPFNDEGEALCSARKKNENT